MHSISSTASGERPEVGEPFRVGMLVGSASPKGGGVFEALRFMSRALHDPPQCEVEVFALSDASASIDPTDWSPVPLHVLRSVGPRGFGYSGRITRSISDSGVDLVHVHGLWMYVSLAARRWATQTNGTYVVSPHGMLDPWALSRSRWKKEIAKSLYENENLRRAGCIHALCEAEFNAVRAFGLTNPVCIIPNGVDPTIERRLTPPTWREAFPADAKILLFLGRLNPKKGLINLIQAWAALAQRQPEGMRDWRLAIAGWGPDQYVQDLKALVCSMGLEDMIHFVGAQFGSQKHATLKASQAFVLPSLSEGLPMAALEAWAHGLPVLLTPECNLPEGYSRGAALRIAHDPDQLALDLAHFFTMPAMELKAMGRNGQQLVQEQFTWSAAALAMQDVYRWLLGRGERPDCVRID